MRDTEGQSDEPATMDLAALSRDIAKLDAFRHAARDMTRHIQVATSQGLCDDLEKIHVQRFCFFKMAVNEPTRTYAVDAAQSAVNTVIEGTSDAFLNNLSHIAEFGLSDFEGDPLYAPSAAMTLQRGMTSSFAVHVAASGIATAVNECLAAMIDAVVEDNEDEMPISYDGLSGTQQRALYKAFIHASMNAMKICNRLSESSDESVITHIENLGIRAP